MEIGAGRQNGDAVRGRDQVAEIGPHGGRREPPDGRSIRAGPALRVAPRRCTARPRQAQARRPEGGAENRAAARGRGGRPIIFWGVFCIHRPAPNDQLNASESDKSRACSGHSNKDISDTWLGHVKWYANSKHRDRITNETSFLLVKYSNTFPVTPQPDFLVLLPGRQRPSSPRACRLDLQEVGRRSRLDPAHTRIQVCLSVRSEPRQRRAAAGGPRPGGYCHGEHPQRPSYFG